MMTALWLRLLRALFGPRPVERPEAVALPADDVHSRKVTHRVGWVAINYGTHTTIIAESEQDAADALVGRATWEGE